MSRLHAVRDYLKKCGRDDLAEIINVHLEQQALELQARARDGETARSLHTLGALIAALGDRVDRLEGRDP